MMSLGTFHMMSNLRRQEEEVEEEEEEAKENNFLFILHFLDFEYILGCPKKSPIEELSERHKLFMPINCLRSSNCFFTYL